MCSSDLTWPPATRNPPAGPITWVTESYASGVHEIRRLPPTFRAAKVGGSTPTGDGSLQLEAAAPALASSASGINHRRMEGRLREFMCGLPGHGVLRKMMQHSGDVLIPLAPGLLSDSTWIKVRKKAWSKGNQYVAGVLHHFSQYAVSW